MGISGDYIHIWVIKVHILASFISDRFSILQNFWKRSKENDTNHYFYGTDRYEELDIGGLIILLQWEKKRIKRILHFPTPTGLDYDDRFIYVATNGNEISIFSRDLNKLVGKISNQYFNDLHSLNKTKRGLLLASSGLDLIIEVDHEGKSLFEWFATDNGYNLDPKGRVRGIDKSKDHRKIKYPTLQQTTHVNSAISVKKTNLDDTIYCCLFHQGLLLEIDKKSSVSTELTKDLKCPHSIYKLDEGYIFSDTANNRVMMTNDRFENLKIIQPSGLSWVQDASLLPNLNLLVADSNNSRLLEINPDTQSIVSEFKYNSEWKIYQAKHTPM